MSSILCQGFLTQQEGASIGNDPWGLHAAWQYVLYHYTKELFVGVNLQAFVSHPPSQAEMGLH